MAGAFQGSLLDLCEATGEVGDADDLGIRPLDGSVRRTALAHGAWIDARPGWIAGADALFDRLLTAVPWRAEKRHMYDRVVDVPRLLSFYEEGDPLPDPVLDRAKQALDEHYAGELGEPFRTVGMCLYRDGRDSVAWHGDTIGRGKTEDTIVAIVAIGSPRTLLLRPRGGGPVPPGAGEPASRRPLRRDLGHGDLLVMGGSCQRTWEHAIPKTARSVGARISIQFRPRGVR